MRLSPILVALLLIPSVGVAQKTHMRSLSEWVSVSRALGGRAGPQNINWIEGGRRFSFTQRSDSGDNQIRAMDPATLKDTLLFSTHGVTFPGGTEPFAYQSFEFGRDSKHLVFQTHFKSIYRRSGTADFYVYSLGDHSMQLAASSARTAELSPDGATLGYERGGDLFAYDMAQHQETRLTSDATETVYNGHFDWMYEEEFGINQGWNWSPDSRYIAFWQVDESAEPVIQISDYSGPHPTWEKIRIPQPGDSITKVRIGVIAVGSGQRVWLETGESGDSYIPRIYWTSQPDTLAVITLNRPQNVMKLFFFDVKTGGRRLVYSETSSTWIDVYDFYAGIPDMMSFPEGLKEFFWISDRDGWQHVYRYDYAGRLLNQVTHGPWSVTRIEGIDPKARTIYYSSTEVSPLQRQLYSIKFDGTSERRLTQAAGTHGIGMSPDTRYYIDRWSAVHQPRQVELWATGGRMLQKMEDNAAVSRWLETHVYSPAEIFSFTASDGQWLDGQMFKPVDFDSTRRYPVIFSVYGGPGSQQVYDAFNSSGLNQWYAEEGYIVVGLNNRGSNNYGSAFEKIAFHHLGRWEAHDFAEAAKYLSHLPYVDSTHIAIIGTSYGGYSTLYTMAMYPGIFSVGIANSPSTSWRLYDAIYTERYMGVLADNPGGYDSSAVMPFADSLKNHHLLLIHSMMDDNVHPQNTMQLLTALTNAGVDADLRIYPPGRHGAAYNFPSFLLIQHVMDDFLRRWLH